MDSHSNPSNETDSKRGGGPYISFQNFLKNEPLQCPSFFIAVEACKYPKMKKDLRKWIPRIVQRADELTEIVGRYIKEFGDIGDMKKHMGEIERKEREKEEFTIRHLSIILSHDTFGEAESSYHPPSFILTVQDRILLEISVRELAKSLYFGMRISVEEWRNIPKLFGSYRRPRLRRVRTLSMPS